MLARDVAHKTISALHTSDGTRRSGTLAGRGPWWPWRPRLRVPAVATFLLLVLSALAAGAPAALAEGVTSNVISHAHIEGHRHYVVRTPVCPPPTLGRPECYAVRNAPAEAGTPNAEPVVSYFQGGPHEGRGGLTPTGLTEAYHYSPTATGTGQTVAIIDPGDDPKIESDLKHYDEHYGLPACTTANGCFEKVGQSGSTTELPPPPENLGELGETSLDVDAVRAVCQNCKIILVEENNLGEPEAVKTAVKLGAKEISNSFGGGESEGEYAAYDYPGVVIVASSGDDGYDHWDSWNQGGLGGTGPEYPAALPDVVAAGGTEFTENSKGEIIARVWNDDGPEDEPGFKKEAHHNVTGSGCSASFSAQPWQLNVPNYSATGCGSERLSTDISADASGLSVYDSNTGGEWYTFSGTSESSPIIAAMFALAGGANGVNYPAATLYGHFGQSAALVDVDTGGNGYCDSVPGCTPPRANLNCGETATVCNAVAGYDGPSGIGTPTGLDAFTPLTLAARAPGVVTQTSATLKGIVDPHYESVNECGFEYKQSGKSHTVVCKLGPGSGDSPVEVSAKVTGLTPNTAVSYRVLAGFYGLLASPEIGFTTAKVAAPAVETKGAGGVGTSSATLYASVNPRGGSVSACKFEYGTTTSYGSSVSCSSLPGSGSSPGVVDAAIASGLAANTEYHYRISATNSAGTSQGKDVTLKTS